MEVRSIMMRRTLACGGPTGKVKLDPAEKNALSFWSAQDQSDAFGFRQFPFAGSLSPVPEEARHSWLRSLRL
jgi:hypothetical protein